MALQRGTPIRIVLVGKTGTGKSSTGNTILRRDAFHEDTDFNPVTSTASQEMGEVEGRQITVVDTPGIVVVDTPGIVDSAEIHRPIEWREIRRCVDLSLPGPHVFLLVVRLDVRFTPEERNAVEWIQTHFSQEAAQFTMVLFTHGDSLRGRSVENLLAHNDEVRNLVASCGGGCHMLNNLEKDDQTQVEELIRKIDAMVERNGGGYYTNKMYREAQRQQNRKRWGNFIAVVSGFVTRVLGGSPRRVAVGATAGILVGVVAGGVPAASAAATMAARIAAGALIGTAAALFGALRNVRWL